jgi:DNA modification methylase
MTYQILHGNNLDILPTLPDNSIDSIVTDPPYELGFMGKKWDSSGIAYSVELWQQCLRVLKPGGHLLSFGGTRTYHRVAVAIEDAGFELRDSIAWLYGSGFPKSLDVSKAIDKLGGISAEQAEFAKALKEAKSKTNMTISDLNEVLGRKTSNLWSHFVGDVQPQLPSVENYWKLKSVLPISDKWDSLFLPEAEREVIGSKMSGIANKDEKNRHTIGASQAVEVDITAPSTPEAQQWQGWGTALKPAFEPVIVARKPIEGTVANNVLKWGTGGLNIDGSRIGTETISTHNAPKGSFAGGEPDRGSDTSSYKEHTGRWPANIILDPYTAELLDEQSGQSGTSTTKTGQYDSRSEFGGGQINIRHPDSGGASRFFYVAKASKRDRNEGLDELEAKQVFGDEGGTYQGLSNSNKPSKNFHPTVKPTSLMEYLIKLVTPPNGTVLDPFTGSGSTGKAAILQGFDFIGIEMTEEYLPIIEGRLKHAEAKVAERIKEATNQQSEVLF